MHALGASTLRPTRELFWQQLVGAGARSQVLGLLGDLRQMDEARVTSDDFIAKLNAKF